MAPDSAHVVAFVRDLRDQSLIRAAIPDVEFVRTAPAAAGAGIVLVDLAHHADLVRYLRESAGTARIVAFGPHVEGETLAAARSAGADDVFARSRFFRDVRAAAGLDPRSSP